MAFIKKFVNGRPAETVTNTVIPAATPALPSTYIPPTPASKTAAMPTRSGGCGCGKK